MTDNTKAEELRKLRLKAVLLEYEDLRDEIKRRMDHRTYISYVVIAMTLGALGLYVTSENPLILVFIPSILIYWLSFVDSSYSHHLVITKYIREKIEGMKLPSLIGKANDEEGWIDWEAYYFRDKKRRYISRFKIYVVFSWVIYAICGLEIHKDVPGILFLLYWIVYGAFMLYFSYKCLIYILQKGQKRKRKKY